MNELINKIGIDKLLHFFAGGWICAMLSALINLQEGDFSLQMCMLSTTFASIIVFVISIIKEMVDKEFNWKDILAAMLGCIPNYVVYGFGHMLYRLSN